MLLSKLNLVHFILLVQTSVGFNLCKFNNNKGAFTTSSVSSTTTKPTGTTRWRIASTTTTTSTTKLQLSSSPEVQAQSLRRRGITIPLLDLTSTSSNYDESSIITPLPAAHLPPEIATLHMYGMQLTAAIHKMMIDEAVSNVSLDSIQLRENLFGRDGKEPVYGHVIGKLQSSTTDNNGSDNDSDNDNSESNDTFSSLGNSLVGAVGCAAEILIATPSEGMNVNPLSESDSIVEYSDFDDPLNTDSIGIDGSAIEQPITVLAKGTFRFIVREMKQTFPYPVAIVDELLDNPPQSSFSTSSETEIQQQVDYDDEDDDDDDEDDDDEEDNYDMYAHLDPSELMQRTFSAMKAIVDQKLDTKPKEMSPLEVSILEESGIPADIARRNTESMKRDHAEEMAAIFDIFSSSLIDIAPSRAEMYYAVGMMGAEFGGLDNVVREKILLTVDGVERLRIVLQALEKKISLVQAMKMTEDITEKTGESSKDLKVGTPVIPPWAKSITKGTKIEYYWSEKDGWLAGTVVDSTMILDELIITILFSDGETERIKFDPEEKARWRPGGM